MGSCFRNLHSYRSIDFCPGSSHSCSALISSPVQGWKLRRPVRSERERRVASQSEARLASHQSRVRIILVRLLHESLHPQPYTLPWSTTIAGGAFTIWCRRPSTTGYTCQPQCGPDLNTLYVAIPEYGTYQSSQIPPGVPGVFQLSQSRQSEIQTQETEDSQTVVCLLTRRCGSTIPPHHQPCLPLL